MGTRYSEGDLVVWDKFSTVYDVVGIKNKDSDSPDYEIVRAFGRHRGPKKVVKASDLEKYEPRKHD